MLATIESPPAEPEEDELRAARQYLRYALDHGYVRADDLSPDVLALTR